MIVGVFDEKRKKKFNCAIGIVGRMFPNCLRD